MSPMMLTQVQVSGVVSRRVGVRIPMRLTLSAPRRNTTTP